MGLEKLNVIVVLLSVCEREQDKEREWLDVCVCRSGIILSASEDFLLYSFLIHLSCP